MQKYVIFIILSFISLKMLLRSSRFFKLKHILQLCRFACIHFYTYSLLCLNIIKICSSISSLWSHFYHLNIYKPNIVTLSTIFQAQTFFSSYAALHAFISILLLCYVLFSSKSVARISSYGHFLTSKNKNLPTLLSQHSPLPRYFEARGTRSTIVTARETRKAKRS